MTTIYIDTMREIVSPIISETDWITVISSGVSAILGALVGGFITYFTSNRLQHNRQKEKQKLLCSVLNDVLRQTKVILVGSFGEGKSLSPYGYIKNPHDATENIIPLFDSIISEIGILPSSKNKTLFIGLYTELKAFLICNGKYAAKLENLRKFRKEMLPENFVKLNCKNYMDYFDLDPILFEEEKNPKSVIHEDFFKAQKGLIDDLISVSEISWKMYLQLIDEIDTIINTSWEVK